MHGTMKEIVSQNGNTFWNSTCFAELMNFMFFTNVGQLRVSLPAVILYVLMQIDLEMDDWLIYVKGLTLAK